MSKINFLFLGSMLLLFAQCSPKIIPTTNDDLSVYLPKYKYDRNQPGGNIDSKTVEIKLDFDSTTQMYDVTLALNKKLDAEPFVPTLGPTKVKLQGWRIQVYRGRSYEEATRARQKCYDLFSNRLRPYLDYSAPTYRVKVGDFLEPYDYKPFYRILKREFPNALPVPDEITIIVRNIPKSRRKELGLDNLPEVSETSEVEEAEIIKPGEEDPGDGQ